MHLCSVFYLHYLAFTFLFPPIAHNYLGTQTSKTPEVSNLDRCPPKMVPFGLKMNGLRGKIHSEIQKTFGLQPSIPIKSHPLALEQGMSHAPFVRAGSDTHHPISGHAGRVVRDHSKRAFLKQQISKIYSNTLIKKSRICACPQGAHATQLRSLLRYCSIPHQRSSMIRDGGFLARKMRVSQRSLPLP